MYGDPDVMRRRAGQLQEQGVDIRALADRLVAQTESLGWTGRAADSMRHETAAESLDRHSHEVERLQETIAETERRAASLVADARTRVARIESDNESLADSGIRTLPDADDRTLVDFTPPPAGHQDWLTVDLPGLRTT